MLKALLEIDRLVPAEKATPEELLELRDNPAFRAVVTGLQRRYLEIALGRVEPEQSIFVAGMQRGAMEMLQRIDLLLSTAARAKEGKDDAERET
jgi:hypothetical protein